MRVWPMLCSGLVSMFVIQGVWAQEMPRTPLAVGMYRIDAEVAANEANRERGLMFRHSLQAQEGMLFVFDGTLRQQCMWMKNTLLPLSVAFMDEEGKIINIEDMLPQTEDNHCAKKPARYALEMNLNWFKSKGIGPGVKIEGVVKSAVGK